MSVFFTEQIVPALETQDGRDTAAGVASHEQVVEALGRVGVTHQSVFGSHGAELGIASRDQLVRIDLVAGIPNQAVPAKVKGGMQCDAQFDHAEVRREVRRARRH